MKYKVRGLKNLAMIFYDRLMSDMELNGTYDENDAGSLLAEEISKLLAEKLDVHTANAVEDKVFELSDLYNEDFYCAGFKDGVEVASVILNHCNSENALDQLKK